jgi:CO dehydrogenase nickel-insertion accessory protein CooC1
MTGRERFPLDGMRIGIFGKGGAGKSTATVLLAQALRRSGYQVCVLDADSTNVGLHRALGLVRAPLPLLDYFGGMVFSGGAVTCPVDDPTPLAGANVVLEALPDAYRAEAEPGLHLLIAGKMVRLGAGSGCDGPISKIVRDLTLHTAAGPLVVLADFKAGFEDSARGIGTGLDWAVVVVDPTLASLELASGMQTMVERMRAGVVPATRHLDRDDLVSVAHEIFAQARLRAAFFVLNQVPDEEAEAYLRAQLEERGIEPVGAIHRDPAIARAWLEGEALGAPRASRVSDQIVRVLEEAAEPQPTALP